MEALEPVGLGLGVVVDERHDRALRDHDAGVASPGKAAGTVVFDHHHGGKAPTRRREQLGVVVDHHDDFEGSDGLPAERGDAGSKPAPTLGGVGGDHDGHVDAVGFGAQGQMR
jgi:hypothetical protein